MLFLYAGRNLTISEEKNMSESKMYGGSVEGVGCDVKNCKYHSGSRDCCTAAHIDVQNKSALNKAETYCGTFCPKGSC